MIEVNRQIGFSSLSVLSSTSFYDGFLQSIGRGVDECTMSLCKRDHQMSWRSDIKLRFVAHLFELHCTHKVRYELILGMILNLFTKHYPLGQ